MLWPSDANSRLTGKDPDAGEDWEHEEKGMKTENEMVEWHHQLNGREFEQTLVVKDREAWCDVVHGVAYSDTSKQLNNTTSYVASVTATQLWSGSEEAALDNM